MKIKRIPLLALTLAAILGVAAACGHMKPDPNRPPDWVIRGSGAFKVEKANLLVGVGEGRKGPDRAALVAASDEAARAALARVTAAFIRQTAEDYMAEVIGVPRESLPNAEMKKVENVLQLAARIRFPGGELTGVWLTPAGDCAYSQCVLDVEKLVAAIATDERVEDSLRVYVTAQAPLIHEKITQTLQDNPVLTKGIKETDL